MSWAAELVSPLCSAVTGLRREIAEIEIASPRGQHCTRTTLAVVLSVIAALMLRVDAPWWAAISAFVAIQVSAPSSIERSVLRIVGTAIGATIAVLLSPWLVEDPVALSLALFAGITVAVLGLQVSRHGYAYMLGGVTLAMVLLAALADPTSVLETACNRTAEVAIGTASAMLVSVALSPDVDTPAHAVTAGWSDLLGSQWSSTQQALRAGLGVMLVPWVWNWLALPNLSQTAITAAAVMAVPAADEVATRQQVAIRAAHRIFGCVVGGTAGLAALALSLESFIPWLAVLSAGVWIGAYVQSGTHGIRYVGTQSAVVFIITLVQGFGPPASIAAGVERFAGITGGLLIVLAVALLTASVQQKATIDRDDAAGHVA